jgi:hypothetical protein
MTYAPVTLKWPYLIVEDIYHELEKTCKYKLSGIKTKQDVVLTKKNKKPARQ